MILPGRAAKVMSLLMYNASKVLIFNPFKFPLHSVFVLVDDKKWSDSWGSFDDPRSRGIQEPPNLDD